MCRHACRVRGVGEYLVVWTRDTNTCVDLWGAGIRMAVCTWRTMMRGNAAMRGVVGHVGLREHVVIHGSVGVSGCVAQGESETSTSTQGCAGAWQSVKVSLLVGPIDFGGAGEVRCMVTVLVSTRVDCPGSAM